MTAYSTRQTEIVIDPRIPLVRIVREFDAPRDKVFRAHTDPTLFVRWNGPNGYETTMDEFDCRTGGFRGCFHEVRPSDLIVQTLTFEGIPDGVALERLVFEDLGAGRTRLTSTSLVDSFEGRDEFVASGMEVRVREGYERLDGLLARG